MRCALIQIDSILPPAHGGAKASLRTMEELAARGHKCCVYFPFLREPSPGSLLQSVSALLHAGIAAPAISPAGSLRFNWKNIEFRGVLAESGRLLDFLRVALRQFEPDAVLLSDAGLDDPEALLEIIAEAAPGRLIYCPKTIHYLPFGPYSVAPLPRVAAHLLKAKSILAPSKFAAAYIEENLGRPARAVYFPLYESPAALDAPRGAHITLINPCAWKGLPIFLELALSLPHLSFAAVPGWGTTADDSDRLGSLANLHIIPHSLYVDDVYCQTRILLVPSLCRESFGQVVIQAMARGIPVLTADTGALPEAKQGTMGIIPVRPIRFERVECADGLRVEQSVPPQDTKPWMEALNQLQDPAEFTRYSEEAHNAATKFISSLAWDHVTALITD